MTIDRPDPAPERPPERPREQPSGEYRSTPNAERYILEADALRRRQLETAMVHGSDRTWRERRRIWPAATAGVVAVVIIVMVVAAVGAYHQQQELQRAKERQQAAERIAGFPVQAYQGHGLVTNLPADWRRREIKRGVRLTDPKRERWLRIEVIPDDRAARRILESADERLSLGCCGLRYYKWLAVRSAKLGKYKGAELEYTGLDARRERRHLVLRVISVRGLSYQVTMSVPDQRQNESQPILDEIARSFTLAR